VNKMRGLVYVIGNGDGQFKIGYTCDTTHSRRLSQIQTMTAFGTAYFVCAVDSDRPDVLESELHRKFWHLRCRSSPFGEWFKLSEKDIEAIKSEGNCNEPEEFQCSIFRDSPFDVRQVCGRQQHISSNNREDVLRRETAHDHSGNKHNVPIVRTKHK